MTSTSQQAYQVATKYVTGDRLTARSDFAFMKPDGIPRQIVPTVGRPYYAKRPRRLPEENIYSGSMLEMVCD